MKSEIGHRTSSATTPPRAAVAPRAVAAREAGAPRDPSRPQPASSRAEALTHFAEICRRLADHATGGRRGAATVWRCFTDAAMDLLGSRRGAVYILDEESAAYLPACARGLTPHQEALVAKHRLAAGSTLLLGRLEETRRPVVASAEEGVFSPVTRAFGVRTLLLVPLVRGHACAGFFITDGGDVALHFPPALRDAIAEGGARLAAALELAHLRRRNSHDAGALALERALATVFATATTLAELGEGVGEAIRAVLGADSVTVQWFLADPASPRRSGRGCRCAADTDTGAMPALCLPFTREGRAAGVLHVYGELSRRGVIPRMRLAQDAAARAAAVAQRLQHVAELERLATRDPLTGLTNRREFAHRLDGELARARREGVPLTVVYLDLDDLKGLNDRIGHPAADLALCELAQRITARVRASDVVARLGGDEFALILPHTAARGALVLFTTLLEALREIVVDGEPGAVSVSGGLATYPAHGRDPDALLRAADAALYSAKRRGKGTACIADESASAP